MVTLSAGLLLSGGVCQSDAVWIWDAFDTRNDETYPEGWNPPAIGPAGFFFSPIP